MFNDSFKFEIEKNFKEEDYFQLPNWPKIMQMLQKFYYYYVVSKIKNSSKRGKNIHAFNKSHRKLSISGLCTLIPLFKEGWEWGGGRFWKKLGDHYIITLYYRYIDCFFSEKIDVGFWIFLNRKKSLSFFSWYFIFFFVLNEIKGRI